MQVKTIKVHGNVHGTKYQKEIGDEYDHPDPQADIAFGCVEPVKNPAEANQRRKVKQEQPADADAPAGDA